MIGGGSRFLEVNQFSGGHSGRQLLDSIQLEPRNELG